jgi:ribosome biogenesis GTPase
MRGLIVKSAGGFYHVRSEKAGGADGRRPEYYSVRYLCRARGILKKEGLSPTVGDIVEFEILNGEEGVVNGIGPRKNLFVRPPVANVDCFVAVTAAARPAPGLETLDRFLVAAERARADVIICVNKTDLPDAGNAERIKKIYGGIYPVLEVSCVSGRGLDRLPELLRERTSALAGASGVGKSALLNALQRGLDLETGEISVKTKRGRHTTRHVELFEMDFGGMVFDTPGFSSFEATGSGAADGRPDDTGAGLAACYPEMPEYAGKCRFDNCRHMSEPGCAVLEAVKRGVIAPSRYESYARQQAEMTEARLKTR